MLKYRTFSDSKDLYSIKIITNQLFFNIMNLFKNLKNALTFARLSSNGSSEDKAAILFRQLLLIKQDKQKAEVVNLLRTEFQHYLEYTLVRIDDHKSDVELGIKGLKEPVAPMQMVNNEPESDFLIDILRSVKPKKEHLSHAVNA
jgi:hypothetical protein